MSRPRYCRFVIAPALALGLLLAGGGTVANGPPAPERPCKPDDPFQWLLGPWVGEPATARELAWSEPNRLPKPRRSNPSRRAPFPASIELSRAKRPMPLELRRGKGPQHGARVYQIYRFK